MWYLLLVLATILIAFQFIATKGYQKNNGTSLYASLCFSLMTGVFVSILFFCLNGFKIEYSTFSLICAAILGVTCVTCSYCNLLVLSRGKMSTYTLFIMMGGMVLPFIYGAIYLNEQVTPFKILGLFLLSVALIIPIMTTRNEAGVKKGSKIVYILLCFAIFILNGIVSILIKHQGTGGEESISSNGFGILYFASIAVTALVFILVRAFVGICKKPKKEIENGDNSSKKSEEKKGLFAMFNIKAVLCCLLYAIFNGFASFLQLLCVPNLDAVVLFPIFTGLTMIFSAVFSWIIYKEKMNRYQILCLCLSLVAIVLFAF